MFRFNLTISVVMATSITFSGLVTSGDVRRRRFRSLPRSSFSDVTFGDNALKKLLTVETQHKAKAELLAADMKLINENATIVYNTVKVCNKKNAGLVNLFSV